MTGGKNVSKLCLHEFWRCGVYNVISFYPKVIAVRNFREEAERKIREIGDRIDALMKLLVDDVVEPQVFAELYAQYTSEEKKLRQLIEPRYEVYERARLR